MRYSRGFNINLELGLKKEKTGVQELKACKAIKKQENKNIAQTTERTTSVIPSIPPNSPDVLTNDIQKTGSTGKQIDITETSKNRQHTSTQKFTTPEPNEQDERPVEPVVIVSAILFFSTLILLFSMLISIIDLPSSIITILLIGFFLSFILALISKSKIKESEFAYRGYGLAKNIIIAFLTTVSFVTILFLAWISTF